MEYVYGTNKSKETLRTKGSEHSNLKGWHTVEIKYPDQIITDRFYVSEKFDSKEDVEGNCYDFYYIESHTRIQDKFSPEKDKLEQAIAAVTPYKDTKTAYIGDTEITFYIPTDITGNITVFFPYEYSMERMHDRIIITFEPLEEVTDITISIL